MSRTPDSAPDLRSGIGAWTHIVDPLFHATTTPMTEWPDDALVAATTEWQKALSIADAQQQAAMALLVRRRVAAARAMEVTRNDGSIYRISLAEAQEEAVTFAASDFEPALQLTHKYAKIRIEEAIALYDELPAVWASLNRGEISPRHAQIIADEVACLDPEKATQVAEDILPAAPGYTPQRLQKALRKAVMQADPEAALRRYQQSRKDRRVTTRIAEDAMGWFSAFLTAAEMTELTGIIDAYARALPVDDDTLDNRRADALVGLVRRGSGLRAEPAPAEAEPEADAAEPAPTATPEPAEDTAAPTDEPANAAEPTVDPFEEQLAAEGAQAVPTNTRLPEGDPFPGAPFGMKPNVDVRVIISAATLLGLDKEPAFLGGYGYIPAEIARQLANNATWRRMLTDPKSGALLDLGHTKYPPSNPLKEHVQERDQTCRFPGCDRKARRCEIDHAIPWPTGKTSKDNNLCLCHYHHRLKTFGRWKLRLDADGTCTWTSPTGHQFRTKPAPPGGLPPPTELPPAPTIPSRKTQLRNITGMRSEGRTPYNPAGEPPF